MAPWPRLRWVAVILLALTPSAVFVWQNRDVPQFGSLHDDGLYYISAQVLAQRGAYVYPQLPGEPAATKYPWLFPAYLSIAWRLDPQFPRNLELAAAMVWISFAAFVVLSSALLRRMALGEWETAAVLMILGMQPIAVLLSGSPMSEMLFCALLAACLLLCERKAALAGGILGGLAFLTRAFALPLLVMAPALFLWRHQRKAALAFLAGMLPFVAAWTLWSASNRADAYGDLNLLYYLDYTAFWRANVGWDNLFGMIYRNAGKICGSLGKLLIFNYGSDPFTNYASQMLGIGAIAGTFRMQRAIGWSHWGFYGVGMCGLLLLWNFPPVERFLLPILPLALAGFVSLLRDVARALRRALQVKRGAERAIAFTGLALIAMLPVAWAAQTVNAYREVLPQYLQRYRVLNIHKERAYGWLKKCTPKDATWLAWNDAPLNMNTGRHAFGLFVPTRMAQAEGGSQAVEYFASLPFPHHLAAPRYLLWSEDWFEADLSLEDRPRLIAKLESSGRVKKIWSDGPVSIYEFAAP